MPIKEKDIQELVPGKPLTRIAFADKPPTLGGKIVYHTPEEISKLLGFEYTESLWGKPKELKKYLEDKSLHQAIMRKPDQPKQGDVLHRLANPLDCFAICKITEAKDIGYGLFALEDIPANTILFLYSGKVTSSKEFDKGDSYAYTWGTVGQSIPKKCVSAKYSGNLSRFMQHLPIDNERHKVFLKQYWEKKLSPELLASRNINLDQFVNQMSAPFHDYELDAITFKSDKYKAALATSNVRVCQIVINNTPVIVCVALYEIKRYEMLGYSYGKNYWMTAGIQPRFFTKEGALVPQNAYAPRSSIVAHCDVVPCILEDKRYCFFKIKPNQVDYLKSLQQLVGKKEIRIKEKASPTAYLLLDWIEQLPTKALDELAFGEIEFDGSERSGVGISRKWLEERRVEGLSKGRSIR